MEHSVDVTAQSLFEAVAQAWRIFGESEWHGDGGRPPSVFVVKVKRPEIEHKVRTHGLRAPFQVEVRIGFRLEASPV